MAGEIRSSSKGHLRPSSRPKPVYSSVVRRGTAGRWGRSALVEVEFLIANGRAFGLSPVIGSLADAERSAFAGRVGAGITDLVMNALGYTWRDNAVCLSGAGVRPDFIYGGGQAAGHGVVLAEAHGSLAENVNRARIEREANRKYLRQVKPHVGGSCPHGKLVHGYSAAFGSNPTSQDTFLHVTEKKSQSQDESRVRPQAGLVKQEVQLLLRLLLQPIVPISF